MYVDACVWYACMRPDYGSTCESKKEAAVVFGRKACSQATLRVQSRATHVSNYPSRWRAGARNVAVITSIRHGNPIDCGRKDAMSKRGLAAKIIRANPPSQSTAETIHGCSVSAWNGPNFFHQESCHGEVLPNRAGIETCIDTGHLRPLANS